MKDKITIIGLGYVGLPLAHAFSEKYQVLGFDISQSRIEELNSGFDKTLELSEADLKEALKNGLKFTNKIEDIQNSNIYIVTVPTPIDMNNEPDLTPIIKATETVAKVLKKGDLVIYESTVYPGLTEEICVTILEKKTALKFNEDFFCGYSPERINPGDKEHNVRNILKITSGSTETTAKKVDELYKSIVTAGTHLAPSIKVAEAAKVIENTQRDINIALINELALLFNKLEIDTEDVLKAAGTKWNFLPFKPGLVGGHCIGVDPYYLTHKARMINYHPEIILAGRRLNDNMALYVATSLVKEMVKKKIQVNGSKILILGLTFKENCPDIRNTKIVDTIRELQEYGAKVELYDPWANPKEVQAEYKLSMLEKPEENNYDAIILAVAHKEFKEMGIEKIKSFGKENFVLYDLKYVLDKNESDIRL